MLMDFGIIVELFFGLPPTMFMLQEANNSDNSAIQYFIYKPPYLIIIKYTPLAKPVNRLANQIVP